MLADFFLVALGLLSGILFSLLVLHTGGGGIE